MQVEMGMASPRVGAGGGSAAAAARGAGGSMAMDAGAGAGTGSTGLWFDLFVAMCNHLVGAFTYFLDSLPCRIKKE